MLASQEPVSKIVQGKDMIDASYVLLKELVQHQAILLSGRELPLFDLLLSLRMDASKQVRAVHRSYRFSLCAMRNCVQVSAAIDAIAGLFCDAIEPLYGIRCLRSSLTSLLDRDDVDATAIAKSHALGSRCLGQLFARLPAEVLEEEVPLTSPILLNVRRHSITGFSVKTMHRPSTRRRPICDKRRRWPSSRP